MVHQVRSSLLKTGFDFGEEFSHTHTHMSPLLKFKVIVFSFLDEFDIMNMIILEPGLNLKKILLLYSSTGELFLQMKSIVSS